MMIEKKRAWSRVEATGKFLRLAIGIFLVLAGLAGLEWLILRGMGVKHVPRSSSKQYGVGSLSVSDDGRVAVVVKASTKRESKSRVYAEVFMVDLVADGGRCLGFHEVEPVCAAMSPTGQEIAVASRSGEIHLLRKYSGLSASQASLLEWQSQGELIVAIVYAPNGRFLAVKTCSRVTVLEIETGRVIGTLPCSEWAINRTLSFSADSAFLLTGTADDCLSRLELAEGVLIGTNHFDVPIINACLSDDSTVAMVLLCDGRLQWRNMTTGRLEQETIQLPRQASYGCRPTFSSNGAFLAMVESSKVTIYDTRNGELVDELIARGHDPIVGIQFDRDGKMFACDMRGDLYVCRLP